MFGLSKGGTQNKVYMELYTIFINNEANKNIRCWIEDVVFICGRVVLFSKGVLWGGFQMIYHTSE